MSALPRGHCSRCGSDVAVRRNGTAREHRPQLVWDKKRHTWVTPEVACRGSGKPVRA